MVINRGNFEAYLLDYAEGHLDPVLTADLMAFVAENPEFEELLQNCNFNIPFTGTSEYIKKHELKKGFANVPEITPENFDEFCVAVCEGLLEDDDVNRLNNYIKNHPNSEHELELYRKCKLVPELQLTYPDKHRLKKSVYITAGIKRFLYTTGTIAATIAILLFLLVPRNHSYHSTPTIQSSLSNPGSERHATAQSDKPGKPVGTDTETLSTIRNQISEEMIALPAQTLTEPKDHIIKNTSCYEVLTAITPIMAQLNTIEEAIPLPVNMPFNNPVNIEEVAQVTADNYFNYFGTRINLWKTAETALTTFNYLTEARVSVQKTLDENGKVTALLFETESYTIKGRNEE